MSLFTFLRWRRKKFLRNISTWQFTRRPTKRP